MKKFSAAIAILILMIIANFQTALASSNLEISTTSNFSSISSNFSGGQTIFVRLESDLPESSESKLNLRDNDYRVINSFLLKKDGSYFKAAIPTPYDAGYYSLEGVVKRDGSFATSVKTIKVGSPTSASVRVNVNSSAQGSNVLGESGDDGTNGTNGTNGTREDEAESVEDSTEFDNNQGGSVNKVDKSFGDILTSIFREIADFFWPF